MKMNKMIRNITTALTIGFLGVASIHTVKAFDGEVEGAKHVMKSFAVETPDLEKKADVGVLQVVTAVAKDVKPEDVKGHFNMIMQKTQDELNAYQAKTSKKPGFWRSFFVGFKHGFVETFKAGVKLVIKAAPAILAMI
jgi:hypothetical protein